MDPMEPYDPVPPFPQSGRRRASSVSAPSAVVPPPPPAPIRRSTSKPTLQQLPLVDVQSDSDSDTGGQQPRPLVPEATQTPVIVTPLPPPPPPIRRSPSVAKLQQAQLVDIQSDSDSSDDGPSRPPASQRPSVVPPSPPAPSVQPVQPSRFTGRSQQSRRSDSDTDSSQDGDADSRPLVDVSDRPPSGPVSASRRAPASNKRSELPGYLDDQSRDDSPSWEDAQDLKRQRPGRMSKGWEAPGTKHSTDAENLLAQLYDATHAADALDNDIDSIIALRRKISKLDPRADPSLISTKADLDSLQLLTSETGKAIVTLEDWIFSLRNAIKVLKAEIKAKQTTCSNQDYAELKFQIASLYLDFADAMERIREGSFREQDKRERVRIWMAAHIRSREEGIEDSEIIKLLAESELGSATGVINNSVISYSGLWALNNPFTELAALTDGMKATHPTVFDRYIIDAVTGKKPRPNTKPKSKPKPAQTVPVSTYRGMSWISSKVTFQPQQQTYNGLSEKDARADFVYRYARQIALERAGRRKKMIIALLAVVLLGLILLLVFAAMDVPQSIRDSVDSLSLDQDGVSSSTSLSTINWDTVPYTTGQWESTSSIADPTSGSTTSAEYSSSSSRSSPLGSAVSSSSSSAYAISSQRPTLTLSSSTSQNLWWTPEPTSTSQTEIQVVTAPLSSTISVPQPASSGVIGSIWGKRRAKWE